MTQFKVRTRTLCEESSVWRFLYEVPPIFQRAPPQLLRVKPLRECISALSTARGRVPHAFNPRETQRLPISETSMSVGFVESI